MIEQRQAHVAVIGAGYVGLPLAVEVARAGYRVTCVDVNEERVSRLNRGESYISDVPTATLKELVVGAAGTGLLSAVTGFSRVDPTPNIIFICVPTPNNDWKVPDLTYVEQAARAIAAALQRGQLVILESTTYPGTTEELVQPILDRTSGLSARANDYLLAFSPERIDPGNHTYTVHTTPKVVGGVTPLASDLASLFFSRIAPSAVRVVSSPRIAEMSKLLENTFRAVNIALVNEFALLAERMDLDIWEVLDAAQTKPFGFMRFNPGPGVGGHCIPVDPHYLSWKARQYDFSTRFIDLAAEINDSMPLHTVHIVQDALSSRRLSLRDSNVLVLGVAFKPNVDDARNSPAERVIALLLARGASVTYHDPFIPSFHIGHHFSTGEVSGRRRLESQDLTPALLAMAQVVVIVTGHRQIDYQYVVDHADLVVDTVNVTSGITRHKDRVWRLGTGAQWRATAQ
jgi:UDP-N-acetyl-D-glucosamine dehydrogenase